MKDIGQLELVSVTADTGAYELQGAGSVISYAWLQHYGLPTDGSVDFVDSDGDRLNNWQQWRAFAHIAAERMRMRCFLVAFAAARIVPLLWRIGRGWRSARRAPTQSVPTRPA